MDYYLRGLIESDREIIYQWRNLERIRVNMYNDQPISFKDHCQWFDDVLKNQDCYYRLFIYQNKPLGLVSFKEISHQNHTCTWGFYIGEPKAPKGSGTIMGTLALDYAFYQLNMRKIIGIVLAFNKRSEMFHKKLGFYQEGLFKKELMRDGQFIDLVRLALFKEDWEKEKEKLNFHFTAEE
jgi:UDP-4-amino-4,6-dideoxy-N-acetyl-beta-L-altrosamine N-acetyltransferase